MTGGGNRDCLVKNWGKCGGNVNSSIRVSGDVTSIQFVDNERFIVSTGWLPADMSYSQSTDETSQAGSEDNSI